MINVYDGVVYHDAFRITGEPCKVVKASDLEGVTDNTRDKGTWIREEYPKRHNRTRMAERFICPFCKHSSGGTRRNFCHFCGADMRIDKHGLVLLTEEGAE